MRSTLPNTENMLIRLEVPILISNEEFYETLPFVFLQNTPLKKLLQISTRHSWSRGMMSACHAGDPGSIPGECILLFFTGICTFHPVFLQPCPLVS
jgi:hypothetical protein